MFKLNKKENYDIGSNFPEINYSLTVSAEMIVEWSFLAKLKKKIMLVLWKYNFSMKIWLDLKFSN